MKKNQEVRQQISALVDGEVDSSELQPLLTALRMPAARSDWDIYHRIGDALRSEQMAAEPSADFSRKLAERLDKEPLLLVPRRRLHDGWLRAWPAALAAAAAASTGFLLSPSLFHSSESTSAPASLASRTDAAGEVANTHSPLLADASGVSDTAVENTDYILLHQSANPSLYGVSAPIRPAALSSHPAK